MGNPDEKRPATSHRWRGTDGDPYVSAPDAGDGSTRTTYRSSAPDAAGLPSAVPSFLEACARLAGRAAAEGNFAKARELIEKAARVAEIDPRR